MSIPSPPDSWVGIPINLGFASLEIRSYAICLLTGMIVAAIVTGRRLTKRGAEPGIIIEIALFAIVFGVIGARIWHVATHPADYFFVPGRDLWQTIVEAVAFWNGGIAIFGSLVGGAFGLWLASRYTGLRFWSIADALAPGLLLAQGIGRVGNYFNHELFGQPTDLPWGLEIASTNPAYPIGLADGTLFHPTFLYELLWNVFGAVLLLLIDRQWRPQWGKLLAMYLIWYGGGRIWFESIRIDPSEIIFGLRSNVLGAVIAVAVGVILYIVQSRRHIGVEPSVYKPGREWKGTADSVDSTYTASDFEHGKDAAAGADDRAPATSGSAARS